MSIDRTPQDFLAELAQTELAGIAPGRNLTDDLLLGASRGQTGPTFLAGRHMLAQPEDYPSHLTILDLDSASETQKLDALLLSARTGRPVPEVGIQDLLDIAKAAIGDNLPPFLMAMGNPVASALADPFNDFTMDNILAHMEQHDQHLIRQMGHRRYKKLRKDQWHAVLEPIHWNIPHPQPLRGVFVHRHKGVARRQHRFL